MQNDLSTTSIPYKIEQCRCIIFDWDGTVIDSLSDIIQAVHYTAKKLNLPKISDNKIRKGIGLGATEQIINLYGPETDIQKFKHTFEQHYYTNFAKNEQIKLFPGIEKTIFSLHQKGYTLAIATGKSNKGLAEELSMLNWQDLFAITCCAEDYQSKPSPEMIKHIASVLDFSNEEIIVVGDSHVDLEMANNAKVAGVGVLTGVSNFETLDSIPHIAILDKAEQLGTILPKL
jgi:phosphoglycolate phosphatase